MAALMQEHFVCPLFRVPSCGINVHKTLQHEFNADAAPTSNPTRLFTKEDEQRALPILNIMFPSTDPFRLQSSMAAAVMLQSRVPTDQSILRFGF
jgi:hypothetical protein